MAEKLPQEIESASWAGEMGEKWNNYVEEFEGMIAPVGSAAISHAGFVPGEKVIDIGCGGVPQRLKLPLWLSMRKETARLQDWIYRRLWLIRRTSVLPIQVCRM